MGETLLLVGLQWGDEGKGKVIDALSGRFDMVFFAHLAMLELFIRGDRWLFIVGSY